MTAKHIAWMGLALLVTASAALAPPASASVSCNIDHLVELEGLVAVEPAINAAAAAKVLASACASAGCTTTFALAQTWDTVDYPFDILSGGPFSATDDYTVDTKDNSFAYAACVL